jgi:hypothetical protein
VLPAPVPADQAPTAAEFGFAEVLQPGAAAPEPADDNADQHEDNFERQQAGAAGMTRRRLGRRIVLRQDGGQKLRHTGQGARF